MTPGGKLLGPGLVVAAMMLPGCTSPKKEPSQGTASSLVYSPAARLPARDRSAGSSGGDANSTPAGATDDPVRPPAGRVCRIHLRREALGVAGQVPYPLSGGNNISADRVQVTGTLERVGRDWLVVRADRSTYWIPRDVVLAVEFTDDR
jgi:hypothetical protein